jgi:hypothetical protein
MQQNKQMFESIRSLGLWEWYINATINILYIIHRLVFYLNHNVSETGFCLRLTVNILSWALSSELVPASGRQQQRQGQGLAMSIGPNWVCTSWRRGQFSLGNVFKKHRTMDNVQNLDRYMFVYLFILMVFWGAIFLVRFQPKSHSFRMGTLYLLC